MYYNLQTIHEIKISCEMFAIFHCSKWSHQRLSPPLSGLYCTVQPTVHSVQWPSTHPPKLDPSSPPHPASGQPRHWARWLRGCEAEEDGGCRPRHKPPGRRTGPSLALTSGQTYESISNLIIFCPGVTRPSCILTESSLPLPPARLQSRAFLTKTNI